MTVSSFANASFGLFRMGLQQLWMPYQRNIKREEEALHSQPLGSVAIVGAGPGDADLLTIKAYKALQNADIVLFDSLVDESVIRMIPPHTEKEFVGKRAGRHSMPQADISQRILAHALLGKKVVRLKGGDPAIFARTAEETQVLSSHDIPFFIVPGITAASGASAFSGVPLTHRSCAQSVQFITASLQNPSSEPNWQALAVACEQQTLVFYMGLKKLSLIAQRLIASGVDQNFPIAVIDNACKEAQQTETGTLLTITKKVKDANFSGPAMIIVGHVVDHQQKIDLSLMAELASNKLPNFA